MMTLFLGFIAGLLVGWNLLPQPEWVKRSVEKLKNKLS